MTGPNRYKCYNECILALDILVPHRNIPTEIFAQDDSYYSLGETLLDMQYICVVKNLLTKTA